MTDSISKSAPAPKPDPDAAPDAANETDSSINLQKLAALAQLHLDDADQSAARQELTAIIAMIDSFAEADVGATAPMSHPLDLKAQLRADVASAEIDREAFQALAPEAENGLYLVPQVIDSTG